MEANVFPLQLSERTERTNSVSILSSILMQEKCISLSEKHRLYNWLLSARQTCAVMVLLRIVRIPVLIKKGGGVQMQIKGLNNFVCLSCVTQMGCLGGNSLRKFPRAVRWFHRSRRTLWALRIDELQQYTCTALIKVVAPYIFYHFYSPWGPLIALVKTNSNAFFSVAIVAIVMLTGDIKGIVIWRNMITLNTEQNNILNIYHSSCYGHHSLSLNGKEQNLFQSISIYLEIGGWIN